MFHEFRIFSFLKNTHPKEVIYILKLKTLNVTLIFINSVLLRLIELISHRGGSVTEKHTPT